MKTYKIWAYLEKQDTECEPEHQDIREPEKIAEFKTEQAAQDFIDSFGLTPHRQR